MRQREDKTNKMENKKEKTLNEKLREAEKFPGFRDHLNEMLKPTKWPSSVYGYEYFSPSLKDLEIDVEKQGGVYLLDMRIAGLFGLSGKRLPAQNEMLVGGFLMGKCSEHMSILKYNWLHMDHEPIYEKIMGFGVECEKINARLKCKDGSLKELVLHCYLNPDPAIEYDFGFG